MFHVKTNDGLLSRNLVYGTAFIAAPDQYLEFGVQACWDARIGLFSTFQVCTYSSQRNNSIVSFS